MIEKDTKELFMTYAMEQSAINIFDFITLACKFFKEKDLKEILERKVQHSIEQGNLDAIPLIGLNSK